MNVTMKHEIKTYIFLGVIFLLALCSAWIIPTTETLKGIIATPAVVALIGAIFQLLRDEAAFKKEQYFEDKKRVFEIGATSHMANKAFDKHVDFCEEYMQEVHSTVVTMFQEGPSKEALKHAGNCLLLRQKYAAWLTEEINTTLEPFEQTIREIGAWAGFVEKTIDSPRYAEKRSQKIDEIYKKFNEVLSMGEASDVEEIYAIEAVKKRVREILGIEELTRIRKYLIAEAKAAIDENA